MLARTQPLRRAIAETFPDRPFTVAFWDGTTVPSTNGAGGPTFSVRSPRALAHALGAPGQLGIGRAYVAGELEPDDLDKALHVVDTWRPPSLGRRELARLVLAGMAAAGVRRRPPVPRAELRPSGRRHSIARDQRAVRHHYDVSNEFFALMLDDSMTYSCALWDRPPARPAATLEEAQFAKLELVCTKLGLQEGDRVLDVGCGWGSFALHAAREHGARVLGITLSEPQVRLARERAAAAGLEDRVEFQVRDYRELAGEEFDAVSSIGMVEHVGSRNIDAYAAGLASVLRPGGRLLNHGIGRLRIGDPEAGAFSERYVFPDGAPLHASRVMAAIERAGFVVDHVEGLHGQYQLTLSEWLRRLESDLEAARRLGGDERVRVWRLYLRAARAGFESGFLSVFQIRAHRPEPGVPFGPRTARTGRRRALPRERPTPAATARPSPRPARSTRR